MSETKNNFKTIHQYFSETEKFIIPYYQRGYKWGVPNSNDKPKCSVERLMFDLIKASQTPEKEYFLQGVTVSETEKGTTLIDGQQRTTTLFLLLHYLGKNDLLTKGTESILDYTIRQNSKNYLSNQIGIPNQNINENTQDVYYFKKALETIKESLKEIDTTNFTKYLLDKVKIIYINIPEKNAIKSFTMLNGQKAIMTDEELIKAELLAKASRSENDISEWEINETRGKFAREWDKWLYWWNKEDVKFFFNVNKPMGLLLEIFYNKDFEGFNFTNFSNKFIKSKKNAKETFLGLRKLQKHFEDWFNDYEIYNFVGLVLKTQIQNKKEFLLWLSNEYSNKKEFIKKLQEYSKWHLVGAIHLECLAKINNNDDDKKENAQNKALEVLENLSKKEVYRIHDDLLSKQLLRMNIEMDSKLQRKFDFSIYAKKSLEHIYPKSWEKEEDSKLKFQKDEKIGVHSVGNLVLLFINDNSSFSDKDFQDKKSLYFNTSDKFVKWSMSLLHTVSVFSQNEWNEESIRKNQNNFIKNFKETYNIK